jgi:hypothetical protein
MDHVPRFGHGRRLQTLAYFLDFQVFLGGRSRCPTAPSRMGFLPGRETEFSRKRLGKKVLLTYI